MNLQTSRMNLQKSSLMNPIQKQSSIVFLIKRCSEKMQIFQENTQTEVQFQWSCKAQVKVTLRHWCSTLNFLLIFRTPFLKNTCGGLFLPFKFYSKNQMSIYFKLAFAILLKNADVRKHFADNTQFLNSFWKLAIFQKYLHL